MNDSSFISYDSSLISYCLGFAFDLDWETVLLLKKAKPEWQVGLWNGVGGKINVGEPVDVAMVREFEEETGYRCEAWRHFLTMEGKDWRVFCYQAVINSSTLSQIVRDTADNQEPCDVFGIAELPETIPNLSWLVPLAIDSIDYHVFNKELRI